MRDQVAKETRKRRMRRTSMEEGEREGEVEGERERANTFENWTIGRIGERKKPSPRSMSA